MNLKKLSFREKYEQLLSTFNKLIEEAEQNSQELDKLKQYLRDYLPFIQEAENRGIRISDFQAAHLDLMERFYKGQLFRDLNQEQVEEISSVLKPVFAHDITLPKNIKILFVVSEMLPFVKTGGLANVTGELPQALMELEDKNGHKISVLPIIPFHNRMTELDLKLEPLTENQKLIMQGLEENKLWRNTKYQGLFADFYRERKVISEHIFKIVEMNGVPIKGEIYTYKDPAFISSEDIYDKNAEMDFERYMLFSWAAAFLILTLNRDRATEPIDIVHVHDWHGAMVPVILKTLSLSEKKSSYDVPSIITLHNAEYSKTVNYEHFNQLLGLHIAELEDLKNKYYNPLRRISVVHEGRVNSLVSAIKFSDKVTTVDVNYAKELQKRSDMATLFIAKSLEPGGFTGITNAGSTNYRLENIDPKTINQELEILKGKNKINKFIPLPEIKFKKGEDWRMFKVDYKKTLQAALFGKTDPNKMLFSSLVRIDRQKGIETINGVVHRFADSTLKDEVQFVISVSKDPGLDEPYYRNLIEDTAKRYPEIIRIFEYSEPMMMLAHVASDAGIMPSRFEPCGLFQIDGLSYGVPTIGRKVGGIGTVINDQIGRTIDHLLPYRDEVHYNSYLSRDIELFFVAANELYIMYHKPEEWEAFTDRVYAESFKYTYPVLAKKYVEQLYIPLLEEVQTKKRKSFEELLNQENWKI